MPRDGKFIWDNGIADERRFYSNVSSIQSYLDHKKGLIKVFPAKDWTEEGIRLRSSEEACMVTRNPGFSGYHAGPDKYIIDENALCDPLLARLPAFRADWRIGHFTRSLPEGYLESVKTGENRIKDPQIKEYYEKLRLITRSNNLVEPERLKTAVMLNLGAYDGLLENYKARSLAQVTFSGMGVRYYALNAVREAWGSLSARAFTAGAAVLALLAFMAVLAGLRPVPTVAVTLYLSLVSVIYLAGR
jgi:arabinofuranosyltransferase